MDNVLYDQVFSQQIESCEISGYGVFLGHKGCIRMWTDLIGKPLGADQNQLAFGRLAKHYMLKDVITVAPDGKSAKGRFDYLSMGGAFGQAERTGSQIGIYNMSFVKEDGVWKIVSSGSRSTRSITTNAIGPRILRYAARIQPSRLTRLRRFIIRPGNRRDSISLSEPSDGRADSTASNRHTLLDR